MNFSAQPVSFFRQRLAQFAGLSAVLAFMLVDLMVGTDIGAGSGFTDWKLVALFLPFLLIPIALTFSHENASALTQYIFIALFLGGIALAGLAEITQRHAAWFNQESLTLATIYIYFLSGLPFFRALFCGISAWLAFGISQLTGMELQVVLRDSYYLLVANLVGAGGLWYLESHAKRTHHEIARLRSDSMMDELTHLLNRRAMDAHLQKLWRHALRESKSLCVLRLNTDDFHATARQLGRDTGNAFLRHVAQVLSAHARRPLDAVARYGNDEFLVVWFEADPVWVTATLGSLAPKFASFDSGTGIGLSPFTLTGSAARIRLNPRDERDLESFMDRIGANLRRAKQTERGQIVMADLTDAGAQPLVEIVAG